MRIRWARQATRELLVAFEYIKKDSPQNAVMVFNKIHELANSLHIFPEKYPVEPRINNPDVRFAVIWNIKLIYAIRPDSISVIRVFPTRRNPKKLKP